MLTINKNNRLILTVIILISITAAYPADSPEIDVNAIAQSNPFAQFTQQRPNFPAPAAAVTTVKPDLFVETATLKFLDAKSVRASISSMSGEYGHIEPDSKGNSLIICDSNENVQKILAQIRKIDRKPEQIMIEVVIVDVKLNDETDIGVNWDLTTTEDHSAVFRQSLSSRLGTTLEDSGNVGTLYNSTGTGSDLALLWPGDIRTVIHVLQEKNNVEIVASPRVMVVSGQTASIEAVEEIPYQESSDTSNGGSLTSTEFKNVGVMLKIGAILTDDKYILLNVESEQSVQTGSTVVTEAGADGVPIVDTRKIQSSLLLKDSQILVIGGLRRKETQKQTNQIPLLGDLPVIGYAFKNTDTVENNSELLVILSPHIYKGEKPNDLEMKKFDEITQRPLLTVPEFEEKKEKKEKEKAEKAVKEAKKTKSVKTAKK